MSRASGILVLALLVGPATGQDVALRVGHVLQGPGRAPLEDAWILVQDGKLAAIAHTLDVPPGVPVLELPGAWAVPGLVDPWTELATRGAPGESARPLQLDVAAPERLERANPDLARARGAGITTCLLSPAGGALVPGWARVLRTSGQPIADARPVLRLVLGAGGLQRDRAPTSRAGALALLREALTAAHAGAESATSPEVRDLAPFARGQRAGLCSVEGPAELRALLELRATFGLELLLALGPGFEPADLDGLDLAGATVVLGPWDLSTSRAELRLVAELDRKGAAIAFTGRPPVGPAIGGRLTAALAIRSGLAPEKALAALTTVPAAALGIAGQAGLLDVGRPADLLLLDGPPLDLSSRVLGVWVEGRRLAPTPAGR